MQRSEAHGPSQERAGEPVWRPPLAALAATFVGIGLARFAYTPLIPALIEAGWFSPSEAAYLGAANLAGYFAGALLAPLAATRARPAHVLRGMMLLAVASFFASAFPLSFAWFFLWRFTAGVAGAMLVIVAPPTVLPRISAARRGVVGGVIFTGVGLGIAASGTLLPWLLAHGLVATWFGLGIFAFALTALAWSSWPTGERPVPTRPDGPRTRPPAGLVAVVAVYGLNAIGLVPHMVFLADYVARGLGRGVDAGAFSWVLFGLGAMIGPMLGGHVADRIGFAQTIRLALVVQALAVGLLVLSAHPLALALSAVVVGALVPGIVPIVLGRSIELAPEDPRSRMAAWRLATSVFALGQAAGAYGFSFVFAQTNDYRLLFTIGAGIFVLALALDLLAWRRKPQVL